MCLVLPVQQSFQCVIKGKTCAEKVFLILKEKNLTHYVVDEDYGTRMINFKNDLNTTLWIKSLKYSPIESRYLNTKSTINFDDYVVNFCEPTRILLHMNEICTCIMNRL